ncbi:hypothetical protein KP77_08960 [Jeotgalibacillus alimentarius]|uniref:DUF4231 domain-containing protein n=1 Tax=Jeotgalibacillus alimentarius TaxID=135826 RepID=A0A0C2SBN9_9BACL|nr:DUF5392 family protein [Jeotgalibacillus alimentarius]KIL51384.1 hypothetical protein KP77_08960 [Jeotgalibacillus alimentarius]
MMDKKLEQYPPYIRQELSKLNDKIEPITKQFMKYRLWGTPLVVVSVLNLFLIILPFGVSTEIIPALILFAVLGAIGMALSKEAKLKRTEVVVQTQDYMLKRIAESDSDYRDEYLRRVRNNALQGVDLFIEFLQKEKRGRWG